VSNTTGSWTLVDVATKAFGDTFTMIDAGWSETDNVWTKTEGGKIWTFTEATGILALTTTYDAWAATMGLDGTPGKENGPNDDPDRDGRPNFLEFAFDGNPLSGGSEGKIVGKTATLTDASKVLTLTLPVRAGATFSGATEQDSNLVDGLIYAIQGSDTLMADSWTLAVTEVTGDDAAAIQAGLPALSSGWTYRTFRSPGSVTDGDPCDFLRAKVTQP
jgi:hypothetical protein